MPWKQILNPLLWLTIMLFIAAFASGLVAMFFKLLSFGHWLGKNRLRKEELEDEALDVAIMSLWFGVMTNIARIFI